MKNVIDDLFWVVLNAEGSDFEFDSGCVFHTTDELIEQLNCYPKEEIKNFEFAKVKIIEKFTLKKIKDSHVE